MVGSFLRSLACFCLFTALLAEPPDQDKARRLASAAELLSLSTKEAELRLEVHFTGIVTAAEPGWNGQFFVQDPTAGVFVENLQAGQPRTGDLIEIHGVSHPGAFAPILASPKWKKLGTAPLPEPKLASIEAIEAGLEDSQRIQISGIVRKASIQNGELLVEMAVGRYRLLVHAQTPAVDRFETLVGARVTVRGTAASHYNAALRHLTSVAVYVPCAGDFIVDEKEGSSPFESQAISLNDVAQYRRAGKAGHRIHVAGTVLLHRKGEDLFLQDASGGLRVRCTEAASVQPGDFVDAVGFLEFEDYLPVLQDAQIRKTGRRTEPVLPKDTPVSELMNGLHHADQITLRGRILDRSTRVSRRDDSGPQGLLSSWLIQGENLVFTMEYESSAEEERLAAIPVGSLVEARGVCLSEAGRDGKLKSLTLLLASPAGVRVLEHPSWFTPARLLGILAVACVVLSLVLFWLVTVSRKNSALRVLMKEREEARAELQKSHDTLEQKVRERTAQLKVEMTARKSEELQFKAVLAERTRLARELHDSLEQDLTGISLQIETSLKLFGKNPENANHHLQLAKNWINQSQVELHRSIWDLRSRELESFNLANALRQSAQHLFDTTEIKLTVETRGQDRQLPEVVEENVLRIAQEAMTNIIKHAHSSEVSILLDIQESLLSLSIRDNGLGGVTSRMPMPGDNHFGLLGMSERAKRLLGRLDIDSEPGRGTRILVEVPLEFEKRAHSSAEGNTAEP
jgi:signal transduction histidine kinase